MAESFYDNFKNKFSSDEDYSKSCPLCFSHYDDQSWLLRCPKILENKELRKLSENIRYTDIFSEVQLQISAIRVIEKCYNYRLMLLSLTQTYP